MSSHRVIKDRSPSRLGDIIGSLILVQVVFIAGKVGGVLDWSWWIVLLPTLLPIAFVAGIIAFGSAVAGFIALYLAIFTRPESTTAQLDREHDPLWFDR